MNTIKLGLSNEDYHSGEGISKSTLDAIAKSPAHYFAKYLDPQRPPATDPTAAMMAGTLAHCAILEPHEFDQRYIVGPDVSRATKEWKAFEQANAFSGMTIIKPDQRAQAFRQAEAVRKIPDVAALLSDGAAEVSAYWHDEKASVLCKCRPDFVSPCRDGGVILLDVKTTTDASPREFARSIAKWRYHVQAAYYSDGYELASGAPVHGFMFVVVENEYPHMACAYMLDDASLEKGREEYRANLDLLAKCRDANEWPGYSNEIEVLSLPSWAI